MLQKKFKKRVLEDLFSLSEKEFEEEVYLVLLSANSKSMNLLKKKYKGEMERLAKEVDSKKIIKMAERILKETKFNKKPSQLV